MFDLVEAMRVQRQAGQRVGVLAFRRADNLEVPMEDADRARLSPADNALQNRLGDIDMADRILYAAILYRRYVVVVLAGFSHTSTVPYASKDPYFMSYLPMGLVVTSQMPTYTIAFDSAGRRAVGAGAGRRQGAAARCGQPVRDGDEGRCAGALRQADGVAAGARGGGAVNREAR